MDNLITGTNSVDEAKHFYTEAKNIFHDASMNLREWVSNSDEVNRNISSEEKRKMKQLKFSDIHGT